MKSRENTVGGIYAIINTLNRKIYIGQTYDLERRERDHWTELRRNAHHNDHLQSAWNKYGAGVFVFSVLEIVDVPEGLSLAERREFLTPYEQMWMDECHPEYNKTPAAGTMFGFRHSEEMKQQMSRDRKGQNKGVPKPEGFGAKISAAKTGFLHSEASRRRMSESMILRNQKFGSANQYAARTHCSEGHEYTPENTRMVGNARICRECEKLKTRQRRGVENVDPIRSSASVERERKKRETREQNT